MDGDEWTISFLVGMFVGLILAAGLLVVVGDTYIPKGTADAICEQTFDSNYEFKELSESGRVVCEHKHTKTIIKEDDVVVKVKHWRE